jgi:type VI secretion system protein VasD
MLYLTNFVRHAALKSNKLTNFVQYIYFTASTRCVNYVAGMRFHEALLRFLRSKFMGSRLAKSWTLRIEILVSMLLLCVAVVGCASGPKPAIPSELSISVVASARSNPDLRGRPSPVVVRVYELKTIASFNAADFFSLNDKDQATLGGDLLHREEVVVSPGEIKQLQRKASTDARALGVVVAYRDLEKSVWRASTTLAAPNEMGRVFGGRALQQRVIIDIGERAAAIRTQQELTR